jgi:hypothetical protein
MMKINLSHLFSQAKATFLPSMGNNFRPLFLERRFLAYYMIFFLVLKLIVFPFYLLFPKTSFFADVVASALVSLTNEERQARGLSPLKENPVLAQAALAKAQDMLKNGYFAHFSPSGTSPWYWFKQNGYNYQVAGENLAIGFVDSGEVENAWENSPSHKQNLLSPQYKEIGIAVVRGIFQGKETTLVVQFFGSQAVLKTQPKESPSKTPEPSETTVILGKTEPSESPQPTVQEVAGEESGLLMRVVDFGATQYDQVASLITNFLLALLIAALILNGLLAFKNGVKRPDLVLKTGLFVLFLVVSNFIDKSLIISLIPHDFLIY